MSLLKMNTFFSIVIMLSVVNFLTTAQPLAEKPNNEAQAKSSNEEPLSAAASDEVAMIHNNNYDLMASDYYDNHPAESIQYQTFAEFFDPHMSGDTDLKMDESNQFLTYTRVRAPRALSAAEKRIRQRVEPVDTVRERRMITKLKKGASVPHAMTNQWDLFDYDEYSMNPTN